jgi:hypothetical protein
MIRHLNYTLAAGHNGITYKVIAHFHRTLLIALPNLFDELLRYSAFPNAWKLMRCIVIPKASKASYMIPKSYCPISLIPCLSKVFEKLAANRIARATIECLAISPIQMGVRCHYSAIDGLLKIISPMSANLSKKKQAGQQPYHPSLLAHDIEGAFNNTNPALFHQVMQQHGMPPYLCDWTNAFTTNRKLLFSFPQQVEDPKPFLCGLPQGSPASAVLFRIYANAMLEVQDTRGRTLNISYVDDTCLLQSSISIPHAIRYLQECSEYQMAYGKHLGLTFSPSKSELLHCLPQTSMDKMKDLSCHSPLTIDGRTIPPSCSVKYLGFHINKSLTFKKHAITAASLGKSSLGSL